MITAEPGPEPYAEGRPLTSLHIVFNRDEEVEWVNLAIHRRG